MNMLEGGETVEGDEQWRGQRSTVCDVCVCVTEVCVGGGRRSWETRCGDKTWVGVWSDVVGRSGGHTDIMFYYR